MNGTEASIELFYPAPSGLPVVVHPPKGDADLRRILQNSDWRKVCGTRDNFLIRAGALWVHGFLNESHEIAQQDHSAEGSYWHALMHRSEGDFGNSMYWFAKVGDHAIFPALRSAVETIGNSSGRFKRNLQVLLESSLWTPRTFVNLCQQAWHGKFEDPEVLQKIAAAEYNLLMGYILDQQRPRK